MLDNATVNKLREMKLSAMANKFAWQLGKPDMQSLSFEERFGMLVDAEWLDKRGRRIDRLIRHAEFRIAVAVEDINYYEVRGITKADVMRLCGCTFVQRHQNLILSGPTGVGKTFISCAIGRCACNLDMAARYLRVSDLLLAFDEARSSKAYLPFRKRLAGVPLLILDDWGLKGFTSGESHDLMELFELRYDRASTVISGQLPPSSWHGLFPDPTLADAILDRIIHNAYKFNLTGESMRKTIAMRGFENDGQNI